MCKFCRSRKMLKHEYFVVKSASIQIRVVPLKFADSRLKIPNFTVSNLSTKVETLRTLSSSAADRFQAPDARFCCAIRFTENMKVLALTAALFALITVAQAIAASIAKSDALLADCVSMAVDALTYLLNIFVVAREGKSFHRELQSAYVLK